MEINDDIERLVAHAAIVGLALKEDVESDMANCSWRSLPTHLQELIEEEEERIANEVT